MSAGGSFQEARLGLRELRKKLDAIDHVLGLMQTLADTIRHGGHVPELEYNRETGEVALRVRVGLVPPKVSLILNADDQAENPKNAQPGTVVPKPSLGDLSDRMQGLDVSGAADISVVVPSPLKLEELRIPSEPEGATTVEPEKPGDGSPGSRQPRADVDATRAGEQAPEAEEKTPAAAGGSPALGHKTGEWTADEERRLLDLHDAGKDVRYMATFLNRKGPGIAAKLRSLLAKRAVPPSPIPSAPAPAARATEAPPPKPRPVVPPPSTGPILPPGQGRPRLEREAEARLEAAASDSWPVGRDLDLVERIARGDGAGGAAEAMGITKDQALARWRELFPHPPTIDEQAAMLTVLGARVHSQGE